MGLQLAIIGMLAGTALGLRYRVFVLVLAVVLALILAAMAGVARGDQFGSIISAMVILGATLQFGYLTGIALHAAAGAIWASVIGDGKSPTRAHSG